MLLKDVYRVFSPGDLSLHVLQLAYSRPSAILASAKNPVLEGRRNDYLVDKDKCVSLVSHLGIYVCSQSKVDVPLSSRLYLTGRSLTGFGNDRQ